MVWDVTLDVHFQPAAHAYRNIAPYARRAPRRRIYAGLSGGLQCADFDGNMETCYVGGTRDFGAGHGVSLQI